MAAPDSKQILNELLSPLLQDFHEWFGKSVALLQDNQIDFLSTDQQANLLERVREAQMELQSAEQLYNFSDNSVGIDPKLVVKWHRLLMECGNVGRRFRQLRDTQSPAPSDANAGIAQPGNPAQHEGEGGASLNT